MSEVVIDGITFRSSVYSLSTGETRPFEPSDANKVWASALSRMTNEELAELPLEPCFEPECKPDIVVEVREGKPPRTYIP
jgi:hypothetical protein